MEETSGALFSPVFCSSFALFFTTSSFASVLATGRKEKKRGRPRNEAMIFSHQTHRTGFNCENPIIANCEFF